MMQKEKNTTRTHSRAKKRRDFFYHFVVYVFMIALMVVLNIGTTGPVPVALLLGVLWGLAVALHGVYALTNDPN